ncbi:hypothetical protein [Corynebacterium sp. 335C]
MSADGGAVAPVTKMQRHAMKALPALIAIFVFGILCLQAFNLVFSTIGEDVGAPEKASLITAIPGVVLGIVCVIYGSLGDFVSLRKMTMVGIALIGPWTATMPFAEVAVPGVPEGAPANFAVLFLIVAAVALLGIAWFLLVRPKLYSDAWGRSTDAETVGEPEDAVAGAPADARDDGSRASGEGPR